jgi:hypothetical protein
VILNHEDHEVEQKKPQRLILTHCNGPEGSPELNAMLRGAFVSLVFFVFQSKTLGLQVDPDARELPGPAAMKLSTLNCELST